MEEGWLDTARLARVGRDERGLALLAGTNLVGIAVETIVWSSALSRNTIISRQISRPIFLMYSNTDIFRF